MLMTGSQYEESLRKLNLVVYLFGERVFLCGISDE
jgi:hypothetical protein